MRRFPPRTVEALDGGFKVIDSNGQSLALCLRPRQSARCQVAKALTLDEARRIASNTDMGHHWRLPGDIPTVQISSHALCRVAGS